ncbi:DcaP family trimeric outer membrane transporter [Hydrocarboniclastica marina]|uniref:Porin n=1 Tax=Hydrocarboniclastica marina TaxID=2259620 RepID=A0A4P7XLQ2_9ALTE|nr:DcaP family trimeric outer membrane transporter [Hydrocarboniclastica marina]QCF27494.1 hypothetical protein soil367_17050 [Hydrocarboniclastica marina]
MKNNKFKLAVRTSLASAVLAASGQASAFNLNTDGVDALLYGYARLNASYDFNENIANSARTGSFAQLGGDDEDVEGHFGADAFQSRLGVMVKTESGLKINVEGDFRGSGGGSLRLRHAYGEYEGVLLGQTWSNYMSFYGITPGLDFDGVPGMAGLQGRTPQARYTTGPLSVALEETLTSVVGNTDLREGLPTFTARYEQALGALSYSVGGLAHQVAVDDGTIDETAFGYATYVAADFALTSSLALHGTVNYTDGASLYLYRSGENFGGEDAYLDGSGLNTIAGYAATAGASLAVGEGRSINLSYGIATMDWDDAENDLGAAAIGGKSETNQKAMLNYLWKPLSDVMMGVEYSYYRRENVDGDSANANRLMFAAQYNF